MPRSPLLAVLALALAWAAPAAGQKTSLAVVELAAPQHLAGIAALLTSDIVAAARSRYAVVDPVESAARLGPDLLQKLRDCGGKGGCIATYGAGLKTARAVVGALDRNDASYLVKLWLVDLKSGGVVSSVDRSVLIASRRLNSDISAALPALLEGRAEAMGKVAITTNAAGATVTFDGEPAGKAPLTLEAKPGKHTLRIEAENYLPIERFVTVEPARTEDVPLTLILVPGAKLPEPPAAGPAAAVRSRQGGGSFSVPTASWIAGGVAVAAGGAGLIFGLSAKSLQDKAGAASPYAITRQDALSGKRDALIANLCYAGAGAALVTGVVIALVSPRSSAPSAALLPIPGGAALSFGGSF